jgi:putative tricarboxylic transport membrane protein
VDFGSIFHFLGQGFGQVFLGWNFAILVLGCIAGIVAGALPGLGSVNGVAILLPLTFLMTPTGAIIFLGAIYYGAMFGGSICSIMLGIPGASTAVATGWDGRPMATSGRAVQALMTSAWSSGFGGFLGTILFMLIAIPLADFALKFGSAEIFDLMLLAFATFIGLGGDDNWKTGFSIAIGLLASTVGLDVISGMPRLIYFGLPGFFHGIGFLIVAIGLYGIGEILWSSKDQDKPSTVTIPRFTWENIKDGWRCCKRGLHYNGIFGLMGFFIGVLPAAGATPGSLMAYGLGKMFARDPDSFGKGNSLGVSAPETANNAASAGSMLPMVTLGIPGSPTTAVLLGGMFIWGLTTGPLLFTQQPGFVWGLISSLFLSNVVSALLMVLTIPLFISILKLRFTILAPLIYTLCIAGGYAPKNSLHDVWLMVFFGIGGFLLRKLDYPMAPAAIAIVLGPLAEQNFRQALIGSGGNPLVFVHDNIAIGLLAITVLLLVLPIFKNIWIKRNRKATEEAAL